MNRRPVTMRVVARTVWIHTLLVAHLLAFVLFVAPLAWVARWVVGRGRAGAMARRWARILFRHAMRRICGHRLRVGPICWNPEDGPCIVVANHQSMLDILLLMQLPMDAKCWAKRWPFRIPLLGATMRICGHLHVEDFNLLPMAGDTLEGGVGHYVFPEGTRSRNGRLGRFRDGAFLLAVKTGTPIVPVAILGSHDCFPPGQGWVHARSAQVRPLGVLRPDPSSPRDHLRLRNEAHRMIAEALGQRAAAGRPMQKVAAA